MSEIHIGDSSKELPGALHSWAESWAADVDTPRGPALLALVTALIRYRNDLIRASSSDAQSHGHNMSETSRMICNL